MKEQSLKHLSNKLTRPYPTRNAKNIHNFKVKHSFFKFFFRQSSLNGINWTKFYKSNNLKSKFYKNKSSNPCMCSKKLACYFDNDAFKFFFNFADALNRYKTSAKEYQEQHHIKYQFWELSLANICNTYS